MTISGIIAAAGSGVRVGSEKNNLFLPLGGRPTIAWTLEAVGRSQGVDELIVVTREETVSALQTLIATLALPCRVSAIVPGGKERQDSVYEGLQQVHRSAEWVLIHDGARPLVTPETISATIRAAKETGAAVAARPLSDTVKSIKGDGTVDRTLDRGKLWTVQTPQVFRKEILLQAHARAQREGILATDDAALVEQAGHPVRLAETNETNLKITTPEDFPVAEAIMKSRGWITEASPRVGFGYDVHRFAPGRPLVLGGVILDHPVGLDGHSDADVVLHAICDALLGAVGERDIGFHFPNDKEEYKGVSSLVLLQEVAALVQEAGYRVNNVDVVIIAEQPKLADHINQMVSSIAQRLGLCPRDVSIKATTNEGMGALGRGEGIAAHAVATVVAARHAKD